MTFGVSHGDGDGTKVSAPGAKLDSSRRGRLSQFRRGRAERVRLASTYFDTTNHKLRRHRLSLRIREAGSKKIQTVKSDAAGPIGRNEWDTEIGGLSPDIKRASETPLQDFHAKKLRRKLKPVFKTLVRRTIVPLRSGAAEVELAIDRGRITAGRRHSRIAEVEIELKRGRPPELFRVARALEHLASVELCLTSKAERGYLLTESEESLVRFAEPINLEHDVFIRKHSLSF